MTRLSELHRTNSVFCAITFVAILSMTWGCNYQRYENITQSDGVQDSPIFGATLKLSSDMLICSEGSSEKFNHYLLIDALSAKDTKCTIIGQVEQGITIRVSKVVMDHYWDFPYIASRTITAATILDGKYAGRLVIVNGIGVSIMPDYIRLNNVTPLIPIKGKLLGNILFPPQP